MKKRFVVVIILAITFLLSACYQQSMIEFNVDFIVDGEVYDSIKTNRSTIEMPVDPKKEGHEFGGWFWDKDYWERPFALNSILEEPFCDTLQVYAKFLEIEILPVIESEPYIVGKFYRLQEAYDLGFLTKEDIQDIAFYFQGKTSCVSVPGTSKILDALDTEIAIKIKQTFLDDYLIKRSSDYYTINDVVIRKYCGNYNGSYAVYMDGLYGYALASWSETVAGVRINYLDANHIKVWVEKENHKVPILEGDFFITGFGEDLINFPYEYTPNYQSNYKPINSILISNKEQLKMFSETYSQSWSEEENCWVRDNKFSDIIDSCDEAYFQNNQIVTFFVTAAGGGYYFEYSSVSYKDGVLTIEVNHMSQGGIGHCALVDWFAIVEVDKVPIDTKIVVKVNNRGC